MAGSDAIYTCTCGLQKDTFTEKLIKALSTGTKAAALETDSEHAAVKGHTFEDWVDTYAADQSHLNPDLRYTDAVSMLTAAAAEKKQFDVIHFDEPYGTTGAVWDTVIQDEYMSVRL